MAPLLTTEEVAAILRVSPRTVRRMGESGELERVHVGSRLTRYRADNIEELVRPQNDVETACQPPRAPAMEGITSARHQSA